MWYISSADYQEMLDLVRDNIQEDPPVVSGGVCVSCAEAFMKAQDRDNQRESVFREMMDVAGDVTMTISYNGECGQFSVFDDEAEGCDYDLRFAIRDLIKAKELP